MSLTQLENPRSNRVRRWFLHLYRWGVFALIIWMIRQQHEWHQTQLRGTDEANVTLAQAKRFFPEADQMADWNPDHGGQTVVNANERPLGYMIQTSPASDSIIGYSGPNNTLIAFDTDSKILGIEILTSGDTPEHLKAVLMDELFMTAFGGLSWEEARDKRDVDGVSGATLTSLAIAEGIIHRLGGAPHSYRFPDPLRVGEVRRFFANAHQLAPYEDRPGMFTVDDARGKRLGYATRTSPNADNLIGFQGPTDTLIALDADNCVRGIAIRRSYETPEYVGWVKDEEPFMKRFDGMSLDDLASLDLFEAQIEGVSGATITSMTIAETLVLTARHFRQMKSTPPRQRAVVTVRDVGTGIVILFAVLLAFSPLRGKRLIRIGFQVVLIVYLGFVAGDMVSQAILVGWAQSGIPWRFAGRLVLLAGAAFLAPLVSRRQLYCHHLCPHGAAQQLLRNVLPFRLRLFKWVSRGLRLLPALLLVWALLVAMLHWSYSLTAIEPFDAYLFRVAGWATIAVAMVGLAFSLVVPMAYCRFGCPTGALLVFLRRHGRSDRFTLRDWMALGLVTIAVAIRLSCMS
ncbi:MAG: FMN-binding protein [Planctomycetes bacterium]|nr:FMN-binding protein [Planctomycetota bacterium]MBL7037604.1 FMN-binding protein [Pirellulaceae bacterium]